MARQAATTIDDLPDQILGHIMELAGLDHGRIVRLVSKRWQRVVLSEPAFWRTFRLTTGRQGQPISQQQAWLLGKLRQLSLVTDWVKEFVVPDWGGLEAAAAAGGLHLSNFLQMLNRGVVVEMDLASAGVVPEAVLRQLPDFPMLETLKLRSSTLLPLATAGVVGRLMQLRCFRCHAGVLLSAELADSVHTLSRLTRLELTAAVVAPTTLQQLTCLAQLSHFGLRQTAQSSARIPAELPLELPLPTAFPSLASFDLYAARGIQMGDAQLRGCNFAVGQHPSIPGRQIGVLCIGGISTMSSLQGLLAALLPAGKPFSYLELEHCQLAPAALRDCRLLAELPALHFNSCSSGGSVAAALDPLLQQAGKLETLSLTGSLGALSFPVSLKTKTGLKKLRFRQNRLEDIPAGVYLKSLELLDIGGENLSHGILPPALVAATSLSELVLSSSSKIKVKRDDIDNVLAEMPSLRRLVVGSATMTAVVAQYIQKAMPHLQVKRS